MRAYSKTGWFVLAAVFLVADLTTINIAASEKKPVPGENAAIVAVVGGFHRALRDGDRAAVMRVLASDAVILESGDKQTRAKYEVEHLAEDIAFVRGTTTTHSPISVQQQGDAAWTIGTSHTTGTFKGRDVNSVGVELMVLTKTTEGWKIHAIHWSSRKVAAGN